MTVSAGSLGDRSDERPAPERRHPIGWPFADGPNGSRPRFALQVVLVIAIVIALRVVFFVGLVSGDPQDDGVYYGNALALAKDGPRYLDRYRNLPREFVANPIDQFNVRPLVTYPTAMLFRSFGEGEVVAVAWPFVCSVGLALVIIGLGTTLCDRNVGLLAGVLFAFYPLDVIDATRILSDVQVGLCTASALLCAVQGIKRQNRALFLLSGVLAAAGGLANARALLGLVALLCCLAVQRQVRWRHLAAVLLGSAVVFAAESATYFALVGDPLLSWRINAGANQYKYLHEFVQRVVWGPIEVAWTNGRPLGLSRSVLGLNDAPTNLFGPFFFLFAAAVVRSLWHKRNLLLVAFALLIFACLEFGAARVEWDSAHQTLRYMMIYKQDRFLEIASAPLLVIAADALNEVRRRQPFAAGVLLGAILIPSVYAVQGTRAYYRSGLDDLRVLTQQVTHDSGRTYWSDTWGVLHMQVFSRGKAANLKVLVPTTSETDVRSACLILGGSRGVELLPDYVEASLPPFARALFNQPPGETTGTWRVHRQFSRRPGQQQMHDLTVYCPR